MRVVFPSRREIGQPWCVGAGTVYPFPLPIFAKLIMCHRFLFAASGSPFLLVLLFGLFVVPACAQPAEPVQAVPSPSPSAKVKPKEIPMTTEAPSKRIIEP
jgi:hypothetical protein